MFDAPFALAFTAGLVATVNPCGFAMLPAYMGYFMGLSDEPDGASAIRRALVVGGIVSSGFLLVFGLVGLLVTLGLQAVIDLIPWAAMVIGVGVGILGIAMLAGFEPILNLPKLGRAADGRGKGSVFLFGIGYAIASLSCTLPIFLAVVAGAIPRTSLLGGVLLFLVYGIGMSLVLLAVTIALAVGRQGLVQWLRRSAASINRVSGGILLLAGVYIVWFWVTSLRDPLATNPLITAVEGWSSQATQLIGDRPVAWGVGLAALVVVAVLYAAVRQRRSDPDVATPRPPGSESGPGPGSDEAASMPAERVGGG
jgi:cytochrome c-type biogenesis protein